MNKTAYHNGAYAAYLDFIKESARGIGSTRTLSTIHGAIKTAPEVHPAIGHVHAALGNILVGGILGELIADMVGAKRKKGAIAGLSGGVGAQTGSMIGQTLGKRLSGKWGPLAALGGWALGGAGGTMAGLATTPEDITEFGDE